MSKIALGTVQFGVDYGINSINGKVSYREVEKILHCARIYNIDMLDTAPAYGNREQLLGNFKIQDFEIVTKTRHFECDIITDQEIRLLVRDINQSLEFLKRKSVYGVLVHNADDLLKLGAEKIFNKLQEFKQQGLIGKIGASIYSINQLQKIIDNFDIDLVQLPFNILDRRLINNDMFKLLKERNIEVHVRSVFLQGLLLMAKQDRPKKFSRWDNLWTIWHEWLMDNNITALEATIRYATRMPEISKVLIGVDSKKQLQEVMAISSGSFPEFPNELYTNDTDLLNPVNWIKL